MSQVVGQKFYLDTNIFIYALEEIDPWGEVTKKLLGAIDAGECFAATSELTLAECLVKPLELGRTEIAQMYLDFLQNRRSLEVVPVSRQSSLGPPGCGLFPGSDSPMRSTQPRL